MNEKENKKRERKKMGRIYSSQTSVYPCYFAYSAIVMTLFHILGDRNTNPTNVETTGPKINMENLNSG